jgi:hypothetical protein
LQIDLLEPVLTALEHLAGQLIASSTAPPASFGCPSTSNVHSIDKQIVHILLIWLMIICKNPFKINRVQQQQSQESVKNVGISDGRIVNCLDTILNGITTDGGLVNYP